MGLFSHRTSSKHNRAPPRVHSSNEVSIHHQSCYKFTKFWFHSGLNVGNIVGFKAPVWLVQFRCRGSCWCWLILGFGIGAGVMAGGLWDCVVCRFWSTWLGGVTNYTFSTGGVPYFGARAWLADSFDVEFYWFGVGVIC